MKALLVVDVQNELVNRELYEKEIFIETVKKAIAKSRERKDLVVYIQHVNDFLVEGTRSWEVFEQLDRYDSDPVFQKNTGNSFSNESLGRLLKENCITEVAVCGLVTNGCIRATCLGALSEGYSTKLIKEAHTSWSEDAKMKIQETESELSEKGVNLVKLSDF